MQPDRVFHFEPPEARALQWLPLAVRYKLDRCGLKVRLQQWQALPLAGRSALLRCPAGPRFEQRVLALVPGVGRLQAGRDGLDEASSFEDYLLAKTARV